MTGGRTTHRNDEDAGHKTGTAPTQGRAATGISRRDEDKTSCERLLSLPQAAAYLGVSYWTVRDLVANGTLAKVALPGGPNDSRSLRRVLIDRHDIDRLIERSKEP
jgi:excisionase family DNA binding protein